MLFYSASVSIFAGLLIIGILGSLFPNLKGFFNDDRIVAILIGLAIATCLIVLLVGINRVNNSKIRFEQAMRRRGIR